MRKTAKLYLKKLNYDKSSDGLYNDDQRNNEK